MLRTNGIIGFNDCGYHSVRKALKFVLAHRKYQEIGVGLKSDFRAGNILFSTLRRILAWSNSDRYFQKMEDWEPAWNFYARF